MDEQTTEEIRAFAEESLANGVALETAFQDTILYLRRYATANDKPELYTINDQQENELLTIVNEVYSANAENQENQPAGSAN